MEKVYTSSKWWEVKDCGETVSELMIGGGGDSNKELNAVLSYLGVLTFCTCILICLVCIVASFKLFRGIHNLIISTRKCSVSRFITN